MSRPSSDATDAAREVSTLYLFPTEGEAAGLRRRRADAAIAVVGVGMAEAAAGTVRALRVWRPRRAVRNDTLKWVLSEVLRDMREAKRCYVKYEVKQGCFHLTAR